MEIEWEKAADHAIRSIGFGDACSATTKQIIRAYYKKSAMNGKCRIKTEGYSGMMIWKASRQ
jgi:hypothetical protein